MFKIFLTNLGKYNEGLLIGKWVELPCDNLEEELEAIGVGKVPYEEYFITDYEATSGLKLANMITLMNSTNLPKNWKHWTSASKKP